jgi:hypothetical protein
VQQRDNGQQYILSHDDVQDLIDVRNTFAYLVNETSDGNPFKKDLHVLDRLLNGILDFAVYDVPENSKESVSDQPRAGSAE